MPRPVVIPVIIRHMRGFRKFLITRKPDYYCCGTIAVEINCLTISDTKTSVSNTDEFSTGNAKV